MHTMVLMPNLLYESLRWSCRIMHSQQHLEHEDKDKRTPLLTATASGSVEAMHLFATGYGMEDDDQHDYRMEDDDQYEAIISAVDSKECNVIHLAVETGDVNVLKVK